MHACIDGWPFSFLILHVTVFCAGADDRRPELAWLRTETNDFGTDEFLKWCEVCGTEP